MKGLTVCACPRPGRLAAPEADGPAGSGHAEGRGEFVSAVHLDLSCVSSIGLASKRQLFLDLDDQTRLVELALEALVLAYQLRDLACFGGGWIRLGAPLLRRQCGQFGGLTLTSPRAQARRVDALAAEQGADLAGLGAAVGSLENAPFVGVGELPASGTRQDLGVGARQRARRRRFARLFSRPTGAVRDERIVRTCMDALG